jgi:hypothetical protein
LERPSGTLQRCGRHHVEATRQELTKVTTELRDAFRRPPLAHDRIRRTIGCDAKPQIGVFRF